MIDLRLGNCLEIMASMKDNSIDLTVTSPPYDNLRTYNGNNKDWNDSVWQKVLSELYRITKDGGVVVWVVGDATIKGSETGTSFRQALHAMECGFRLHDTMIWNKGSFTAVGTLKYRYASVFEYMFVFSKGSVATFNPIKDRKNKWAGDVRKHLMIRQPDGSTKKSSGYTIGEFGQRFNVWEQPTEKNSKEFNHPAMFPESLANDHILSWSNEGDTVFDCFMGSGTTGKMALLNKRNFIGIELDEEYFKIAQDRINSARPT